MTLVCLNGRALPHRETYLPAAGKTVDYPITVEQAPWAVWSEGHHDLDVFIGECAEQGALSGVRPAWVRYEWWRYRALVGDYTQVVRTDENDPDAVPVTAVYL